jgi:hypothetical protein
MTDNDKYIVDAFFRFTEILTKHEHLDATILYLRSFKATSKWNEILGHSGYIQYHYEAYLFILSGLIDRYFHLINHILQLNINDYRKQNLGTLIQDNKVQGTKLEELLKEIRSSVKQIKYLRNSVMHERSYDDEDLTLLSAKERIIQNQQYSDLSLSQLKTLKLLIGTGSRAYRKAKVTEITVNNKILANYTKSLMEELLKSYQMNLVNFA